MSNDGVLTFATINALNLQLADRPTYDASRPTYSSRAAYRLLVRHVKDTFSHCHWIQ